MNEVNLNDPNYQINFEEDKKKWDQFVKFSPQRNIFIMSNFLDSLKHRYQLVTLSYKNEIVVGTVLLIDNYKEPIKYIFPFTQYQGVLFASNKTNRYYKNLSFNHKNLEKFLNVIVEHFKKINLCNSWRLYDLRAFQWFNYGSNESNKFNIDLLYTGILNLNDYENFEDYLKNIRSVRRQEFRKAEKQIKLVKSDDVCELVKLYDLTFKRQGIEVSKYNLSLIESIAKKAIKEKYGRMYFAYLDDILISGVFFLFDDRTAFYLIGASNPKYRNCFGSTFLLLNVIKEQFQESVIEIDFIGTNSPNRGDYKLSFNCNLKQFSNITI